MADSLIDVAILMLVVDRHIVNAPKLMEHAHSYYPEFPIYVLDNTMREHEPFPDYVTVYKNDTGNLTTAWSRKLLVEKIEHEFVWFLDDDDDVSKVDFSSYSSEYDVHNFGYISVNRDKDGNETRGRYYSTVPLWPSFIRTSLLKEVQKHITIDVRAVCNEDDFVTQVVFKLTDKIQYHKYTFPYINNVYASNSFLDEYGRDGYNKFVTVLSGRKQIQQIVDKHYSTLGVKFNDPFYVIKMFRTEGLFMKELLIEALFEAGIDSQELYQKCFDDYRCNLTPKLYSEIEFLLTTMFPDFKVDTFKVWKFKTEKRIDEFGREITVISKEWFEDYANDYKEAEL